MTVAVFPIPFEPATSHRIEVIAPGLLRKDLGEASLIGDARRAKPAFLHDPGREPAAYRCLVNPLRIGPRCLGSGADWVVLEHVTGSELWQVDDIADLATAARALARMHRRLSRLGGVGVPLIVHDDGLATTFRRRAAEAGTPATVLAAHERACRRLFAGPRSVIHGEAYPSNIILRPDRRTGSVETVFLDWEMVGLGPAVLDVAALTAGSWPAAAVDAMTRAYFDAATSDRMTGASWEAWNDELDAARLYISVQWLGWAQGWRPPVRNDHDWLSDALALAQRL